MQYTTRCAYYNNIYTYVLCVDRADPLLSAILTGCWWASNDKKKRGRSPSELVVFLYHSASWANFDDEVRIVADLSNVALKVGVVIETRVHPLVIKSAP